jgi:hypothetical protein
MPQINIIISPRPFNSLLAILKNIVERILRNMFPKIFHLYCVGNGNDNILNISLNILKSAEILICTST